MIKQLNNVRLHKWCCTYVEGVKLLNQIRTLSGESTSHQIYITYLKYILVRSDWDVNSIITMMLDLSFKLAAVQ